MGLVLGNYTKAGFRRAPLGGKQKEVPGGLGTLVSFINQPQTLLYLLARSISA